MDIIQSAAFEMLVNVALAVLALAGAYAVYYIRLGASKLKAQTAQIEDASTRKVLDDALKDVENLATLSVSAMEQTTAKALREALAKHNPKSVKMATLLFKPKSLTTGQATEVVGFEIHPKVILGHGLDLDGQARGLRDILVLKDK